MVVCRLRWPNSNWIVRISVPFASNSVAKLCLKQWTLACFWTPARVITCLKARWTVESDACHRTLRPLVTHCRRTLDGKTNCQGREADPDGYFRSSASGIGA